jgi:hypothetical protein
MCTPSRINPTKSSSSKGIDRQASSCAAVFATNRRLTLLLLVPRLVVPRRQRLEAAGVLARGHADQHLLDDAAIQRVGIGERLKGRQRELSALASDPRSSNRDFAPAEHHFAGHRTGARGDADGLMGIARPTDRGAILFHHHVQHLQLGPDRQLEELRACVDKHVNQGEMALWR